MRLAPIVMVSAAVVAGCATSRPTKYQPPPPASLAELRATAPTASNYKVCRGVIVGRGDLYTAAHEEQQRRSLDCGPYVQAVMDEQRQQQGGLDPVQAMRLLNSMPAYQPYQVPPPPPVSTGTVNCTSSTTGSYSSTTCR